MMPALPTVAISLNVSSSVVGAISNHMAICHLKDVARYVVVYHLKVSASTLRASLTCAHS